MHQTQDYRLSLSARISALERVVEQLAIQHLSGADNAVQLLAEMRKEVTASLEVAPMNTGGVHLSPQQQEWLRRESTLSKKEAGDRLMAIERSLGST